MPTFAEYVPVVSAAVTDGTRKAYGTYWNFGVKPAFFFEDYAWGTGRPGDLEAVVGTIDSFSGVEHDIVIVGCTRSNGSGSVAQVITHGGEELPARDGIATGPEA